MSSRASSEPAATKNPRNGFPSFCSTREQRRTSGSVSRASSPAKVRFHARVVAGAVTSGCHARRGWRLLPGHRETHGVLTR